MRIKAKDFEKTMAVTQYLDYFYALCSNTAPSEAVKDHAAQLAYLVENQIAQKLRRKAKYSRWTRTYRIPASQAVHCRQLHRLSLFFARLEMDKYIPSTYIEQARNME
ncbi:hypothetical protein ORY94_08575 [Enterococcus casseliflavus]|uniref:hypothetical protein n=1 Tax=Enterococcus casseliflavus TaxID=37734 RepID=UPI0022519E1C|nr:hypothetical protein [Enterococcus casseliflavus]MCX4167976.1 hypothetical protein [Enterococcus casseliflavus]